MEEINEKLFAILFPCIANRERKLVGLLELHWNLFHHENSSIERQEIDLQIK